MKQSDFNCNEFTNSTKDSSLDILLKKYENTIPQKDILLLHSLVQNSF
jgi:hypothetical protein